MNIDFDDNVPIYIQVMETIKKQIISQKLKEGEKLVSVREMSSKLRVNPNTVQRAYKELEREGIVFTQRGMGTFVTEDKNVIYSLKEDTAEKIIENFIVEMKELGFDKNEIIDVINKKVGKE